MLNWNIFDIRLFSRWRKLSWRTKSFSNNRTNIFCKGRKYHQYYRSRKKTLFRIMPEILFKKFKYLWKVRVWIEINTYKTNMKKVGWIIDSLHFQIICNYSTKSKNSCWNEVKIIFKFRFIFRVSRRHSSWYRLYFKGKSILQFILA